MIKCLYFGVCGGCSLQNLEYSTQIENKKKDLAKSISFEDIIAFSGNEFGYRNRMDLLFTKQGLGIRKCGRWDQTIDIEQCLICNKRLNDIILEIRNFFKNIDYFNLKKHTGTFRYSVIRTPRKDSSISFVLNSEANTLNDSIEKIKEFSKITNVKNIAITYVPPNREMSISDDYFMVKGLDFLKEEYLGKNFRFAIQGFFQNNSEMAEKMQSYCNNLFRKYNTKGSYLLDLYGGVGTFGIINSNLFKEVLIIESMNSCINAANENIKENNLKNVKGIVLDAKHLKKIEFNKPLFVITDPPRSGMHHKTIEYLNYIKPELIIYISCNVKQLSKDIQKFKEYKIKSAALFDLFPQTNHSEAIIELEKK